MVNGNPDEMPLIDPTDDGTYNPYAGTQVGGQPHRSTGPAAVARSTPAADTIHDTATARISTLVGCVKKFPQTDERRSVVFVEGGPMISGRGPGSRCCAERHGPRAARLLHLVRVGP
jgi:hypothetical protein